MRIMDLNNSSNQHRQINSSFSVIFRHDSLFLNLSKHELYE